MAFFYSLTGFSLPKLRKTSFVRFKGSGSNGRRHSLRAAALAIAAVMSVGPARDRQARAAFDGNKPNEIAESTASQAANRLNVCRQQFRIVIDVGHTENMPGAISARGQPEYKYNLKLASSMQVVLTERGYQKIKVLIIADGPNSLKRRSVLANEFDADLFVSVHHDSVQPQYLDTWTVEGVQQRYSDRYRGFSLFVSKLNKQWDLGLKFAGLLADNLLARGFSFSLHHAEDIPGERRTVLAPDKGVFQFDNLVVLRDVSAPAVLIEAGVIVHRDEELLLRMEGRRRLMGDSLADALDAYCRDKFTFSP